MPHCQQHSGDGIGSVRRFHPREVAGGVQDGCGGGCRGFLGQCPGGLPAIAGFAGVSGFGLDDDGAGNSPSCSCFAVTSIGGDGSDLRIHITVQAFGRL